MTEEKQTIQRITVLSLVTFLLVAIPEAAFSQEPAACGGPQCAWCGEGAPSNLMGSPADEEEGEYNGECHLNFWWCEDCPDGGGTALNTMATTPTELALMTKAATVEELARLVQTFETRLLLVKERNLVVIQGTTCNPNSLQVLVPLSPEKIRILKDLNVRPLSALTEAGR